MSDSTVWRAEDPEVENVKKLIHRMWEDLTNQLDEVIGRLAALEEQQQRLPSSSRRTEADDDGSWTPHHHQTFIG